MTHISSTHVVHTSDPRLLAPPGQAGILQAGRLGLKRRSNPDALGDAQVPNPTFTWTTSARANAKSCRQPPKTLDAEVVMLRSAMQRFFRQRARTKNRETIERLGTR